MFESAIYILFALSKIMDCVKFKVAVVAKPFATLSTFPAVPDPITLVTAPDGVTLRIQLLSESAT